jgi:hypothetical protein
MVLIVRGLHSWSRQYGDDGLPHLLKRAKAGRPDVVEQWISHKLICDGARECRFNHPEVARPFKSIAPLPRMRSGLGEPLSRLERIRASAQDPRRRDISVLRCTNSSVEGRRPSCSPCGNKLTDDFSVLPLRRCFLDVRKSRGPTAFRFTFRVR